MTVVVANVAVAIRVSGGNRTRQGGENNEREQELLHGDFLLVLLSLIRVRLLNPTNCENIGAVFSARIH